MNPLPPQDLSPPNKSSWRLGITLACGAHLLLILALAWGVNWSSSQPVGVEAELWSAAPQIAAPRPTAPPPEAVKPPPKPQPPPPVQPSQQELHNAQIAIEKAKKEEQKKKDAEQERKLADKREREAEAKAQEEAEIQKQKRKEKEEERKTKEQQEKAETTRQQMLKRIQDQAQGTGDPASQGKATQTSGPSANYAGRIRAKIKPNIVFNNDTIPGNPEADVEVRLAPDGRIQSQRLIASSGIKEWDEAVLRAIERTERLPLDEGKVPAVMVMTFRPKD